MPNRNPKPFSAATLYWWITLIVATLAVPAFGALVALLIPIHGVGQIIVFIIACWLCTYLGMRLMKTPAIAKRLELDK